MTHHSDLQPRVPVGHPDGGAWRGGVGDVGGFDLRDLSDEDYNKDGSFEYPPAPRSADQLLKFWAQVPVSDTLLQAIEVTFNETRSIERNALEERARQEYRDAPISERLAINKQFGGMDGLVEARVEADKTDHPAVIRADDLRTVARAAQAYHQAQSLSEDQRAKVLRSEVFLNARGGITLTVETCEERYGLNNSERQFREHGLFVDQTRWVGDQVLKVQAAVNSLTDFLTPSAEEIMDQLVSSTKRPRR